MGSRLLSQNSTAELGSVVGRETLKGNPLPGTCNELFLAFSLAETGHPQKLSFRLNSQCCGGRGNAGSGPSMDPAVPVWFGQACLNTSVVLPTQPSWETDNFHFCLCDNDRTLQTAPGKNSNHQPCMQKGFVE